MILVKDKLKEANKTTLDYLNWLEDGRKDHKLDHLSGNLIVTEKNGGSANSILIAPELMDNFEEFLNE